VRQQLAGVFYGESLHIHDSRLQAGCLDGHLALLDILGACRNEQYVDHVRIALAIADDFEVEADLFHRERDVLIRLQLDLAFQVGRVQILRHLNDFRDRGVATDRDRGFTRLGARALVGAPDGFTDRIRIDDGFLVNGVRRSRLGRVGFDAIATTAFDQLDELDGRGRNIESDQRSFPTRRKHSFSFPTREVGLESYTCFQLANLTISHSRWTPL
jgi:hypothetical protein